MLLIAVCDDEASERAKLYEAIVAYLKERNIEGKVVVYDSAESIIAAIAYKRIRFDIIFMDIIMGRLDGMACARLIRSQDTQVALLFLTSSTDFLYEGYEVDATAYLIKPVCTTKLAAALSKTLAKIDSIITASIAITSGGITRRLMIKDIRYAESQKNRIEIATVKNSERVILYTTLDRFELLYPSAMWIRSHKSFVVNFLHIAQYSIDKFILTDGTAVPISRVYKDKARAEFFQLLHAQ
jgi:two-component system, LytTR family, response regulator LytT